MDQNDARQLETCHRLLLACSPQFSSIIANGDLRVDVLNEDIPQDAESIALPAIILTAHVKDDFFDIKDIDGRWAKLIDFKATIRVDGTEPGSAAELESLAGNLTAAIESNPSLWIAIGGWKYLRFKRTGEESGNERGARVRSIMYEFRALSDRAWTPPI